MGWEGKEAPPRDPPLPLPADLEPLLEGEDLGAGKAYWGDHRNEKGQLA